MVSKWGLPELNFKEHMKSIHHQASQKRLETGENTSLLFRALWESNTIFTIILDSELPFQLISQELWTLPFIQCFMEYNKNTVLALNPVSGYNIYLDFFHPRNIFSSVWLWILFKWKNNNTTLRKESYLYHWSIWTRKWWSTIRTVLFVKWIIATALWCKFLFKSFCY